MIKNSKNIIVSLLTIFLLFGCESNPQNVDVKLVKSAPTEKFTIYSDAINKIGMMTEIYDTKRLKIMTTEVSDNTGTSVATSAEIPRDITEMVKSSLNSIGGRITYIPYDPNFLSNNMAVGYSEFANKLIPDVIVSGGITEFDRALVSKGEGMDLGLGGTVGGQSLSLDYKDKNKSTLARVTLDFNLVDFRTFAGIPRVQAINSIQLSAATKETSIGFQIIGNSFGVNGDVKKVQGRHAAVRLLVQLSMLQIIGRYQGLPYWNLIPGARVDQVVVDRVIDHFYAMSKTEQIIKFQELLFLKEGNIDITGQYDSQTKDALNRFADEAGISEVNINANLYWDLYNSIAINREVKHRRKVLSNKVSIVKVKKPKKQKKQRRAKRTVNKESGKLRLWTDKSNYKIGDIMSVKFSVDKPMYARLVIVNSQGEVSTLFPNPMQNDNFLQPGQVYQIPPAGAEFTLDIGGPAGTDFVKGVASKNPIPAGAIFFDNQGAFDARKMSNFPIRSSTKVIISN